MVLLLDGKTFAEDEMVIALGVTVQGHKIILGFVQTATENARVCSTFLRDLVTRGLRFAQGLLVVIDGSKGLRCGIQEVFGEAAAVQRCTRHKGENIVAHLPTGQQATWRQKVQRAYEQPTYAEAKAALDRLARELRVLNESAARGLAEGLEETLSAPGKACAHERRWKISKTGQLCLTGANPVRSTPNQQTASESCVVHG